MAEQQSGNGLMDRLVALCKRRGFIFQSSEIYGGINGFWDYGPLGVELKRNIKDAWWTDVVRRRDDMVGLDSSIIMNPKVWEASGHVGGFQDPMVACKADGCRRLFRADKVFRIGFYNKAKHDALVEMIQAAALTDRALAERLNQSPGVHTPDLLFSVEADSHEDAMGSHAVSTLSRKERELLGEDPQQVAVRLDWPQSPQWPREAYCPACKHGLLTEPRAFNLMFESHTGALQDSSSKVYLRPETAQGIFCNYKNILDTSRVKLPFGIAQIGKAFRNEINPRNFTFRSREFEQMEIEFFCRPDEAPKWYEHWRTERFQWYVGLGLRSSRLRLRDHQKDELAHYAAACADIEYDFPFGVSELEGVANRTDFDLSQHQKFSGKDMAYFDEVTKERFIPYVIEPSGGVDRATLAFLCEAYTEDTAPDEQGKPQPRTLMKLHPRLAPVKVAVLPLVNRETMPQVARRIYDDLKAHLAAFYDDKGAIGRRYRRQDEAGTPFAVTVDGQTLQDNTVTVRDRDTLRQERIQAATVLEYVRDKLRLG